MSPFRHVASLALLAILAACANAKTVQTMPDDAGTVRQFDAPYEKVKDAAYGGLRLLKLYPEGEQDSPSAHVILLARPPHGMSWGEVGRITIEKSDTPPTTVRVIYLKRTAFQMTGGEERFSRHLFARMDEVLARPNP